MAKQSVADARLARYPRLSDLSRKRQRFHDLCFQGSTQGVRRVATLSVNISRRIFNKLAGSAVLGALADSRNAVGAPIHSQGDIVLEDEYLRCEFSRETGALVRLLAKKTGWLLQRRPELGLSFRLHAPLPDRRDNFVLGHRQRLVSVEQASNTHVELTWKNLLSEHGGRLPVTFTSTVTLTHGSLTFAGKIINDSDLTIETLDYPYLGDLTAPKASPRFRQCASVTTTWRQRSFTRISRTKRDIGERTFRRRRSRRTTAYFALSKARRKASTSKCKIHLYRIFSVHL